MALDFHSLELAVSQLKKSIEFSTKELATNDPEIFEQFRNSVIQCYEFTYELCWKMVKRRVEADAPDPSLVDRMSFKELMREAAERGYIADPTVWFQYREDRNLASHTYSEGIAQQVYVRALLFLKDAENLLNKLKKSSI